MSEINPFESFEDKLDHSFESLKNRIETGFRVLDSMAHVESSQHNELEVLSVIGTDNGVSSRTDFSQRTPGQIHVSALDSKGNHGFFYRCKIINESSGEDTDLRHYGDTRKVLTQLEWMILVVSTLEVCVTDVTNGSSKVIVCKN